jgi:predicted nucleic acid-binding protein
VRFLDANIFIRLLTHDAPVWPDCERLFEALEDDRSEATTSESVIAEVVYVLTSPRIYAMERAAIVALLRPLLLLPGLRLSDRAVYVRALDLYLEYQVDFEDALSVSRMEREGIAEIVSYDRDFDRFAGIDRVEP